MSVYTGDYIEHIRDDALQSTYYTFTPRPLMSGNFYTTNDNLAALLADTYRVLGILEGMEIFVPEKELWANLTMLQESCFSKMIDYPDFNIISLFEEQRKDYINNDIQNILSAYRYATKTTQSKLNYNDIVSRALHGDDSTQKITPRKNPMFLAKATINYRQYNPTTPENINSALFDINQYIESSNSDILIKAALCHYQFEMIHPYECYNGIVGRILPYHMLSNAKLNGMCFCAISTMLYRHKDEYFDRLRATQKSGNYISWIEFFIRIINEASQYGIEFIRQCNTLFQCEEEKILVRCQDKREHTSEVYQYFKRNIVSSIGRASEQLQASFRTVSKSVAILQSLGVLSQITDGSRNRMFAHSGIMKHLISFE